jgi:serine/threonine protein kinase
VLQPSDLQFGLQMVRGIQYAHSKGVVHLDLKLENFLMHLVGNDMNVLVTDFGLAIMIGSLYCATPSTSTHHARTRLFDDSSPACWAANCTGRAVCCTT